MLSWRTFDVCCSAARTALKVFVLRAPLLLVMVRLVPRRQL